MVDRDVQAEQQAKLYSDKAAITPSWLRVSSTPWLQAATLNGGYGRKIDDTAVSHDAPNFFHIKELMEHKHSITVGGFVKTRKWNNDPAKHILRDDTSVSLDAPNFFHIKEVMAHKIDHLGNAGHEKLMVSKLSRAGANLVLCEPHPPTHRQRTPICWDPDQQ